MSEGEPTRKKEEPFGEIIPKKDIEELAKGLSKQPEEVEGFIRKKLEKMSRRDFLKIAALLAAGGVLAVYKYLENGDQQVEEASSEKSISGIKEFTDLSKEPKMESFKKLSKYAEAIKNSKKQDPKDFANGLSKKNFDSLIFGGEVGGGGAGQEAAAVVEILEGLRKNGKKISVIAGFRGLSSTDVEAINKFNGGGSPEELMRKIGVMRTYKPLLDFAKKNSIEITWLEKEKPTSMRDDMLRKDLGRFEQMSERAGELVEENKGNGIVVSYVSHPHVTVDSWENENILHHLKGEEINTPPKEEVLKNNYTIKEHLEKKGLNPVALQIEDWKDFTSDVRIAAYIAFNDNPKYLQEASKIKEEKYRLEEEHNFVVPYPKGGKNTFVEVIPGYTLGP